MRSKIIILVLLLFCSNLFGQNSIFWLNKPNKNQVQWVQRYGNELANANIFHSYTIPTFYNTSSYLYRYNSSIDWSGERWITKRQENFGNQYTWLCYSFDGVNWVNYNITGVNSYFWDAYNNTWIVSTTSGDNAYTLKSSDGRNWTSYASNSSFGKIISAGSRYVSVSGSTIMYSRDAIAWNFNDISNTYPNASLRDVVWNGDKFAIVGSFMNDSMTKQAIWSSVDGANYTLAFRDDNQYFNTFNTIGYYRNQFIITENIRVLKATDLSNPIPFFGSYTLYTEKYLAYNKDMLLIYAKYYDGYNDIIDLLEWNQPVISGTGADVIYNNIPAFFNSAKHRSVTRYSEVKATCPEVELSIYAFSVSYMDMRNTLLTDGALNIISRGVCWNTTGNPTIANSVSYATGNATNEIVRTQPLSGGTLYYMRAFVQNEQCITYSNEISLITYSGLPASLSTIQPYNISSVSAKSGGTIYNDGGLITHKGVCWSTSTNPTTSNSHTDDGGGSSNFVSNITGLSPSTTYYVRAYVENNAGNFYGDEYSFTTGTSQTIPLVTTAEPQDVTSNSAHLYGNVDSDGGSTVSENGFCYSTSPNPTVSGTHTAIGSGVGSFDVILSGIATGQIYYIKAYAINGIGVGYGEEKIVSTINGDLATVITYGAFNVTETSAYIGGSITDDGGSTIAHSGFIIALNTSQDPTLETNLFFTQVSGYSSAAQFVGLTAGTEYKARIYATNDAGTTYGNIINFQTVSSGVVPIVTTAPIVNIQNTSATGGGNVTFDGGSSVTARGVQFSLNSNFTSLVGSTTNGTGIGTYSSNIIGLSCGVTYFVRAYATNSSGTGYGNTVSFIPIQTPLITANLTGLTANPSYPVSIGGYWTVTLSNPAPSTVIIPISITNGDNIGTVNYNIQILAGNTTGEISVNYYFKTTDWTAYATFRTMPCGYSSGTTANILIPAYYSPVVGESYGGGIVAYIFQSGDLGYVSGEYHGIIVTSSDISTGIYWGSYASTGATSLSIGSGLSNTNTIVSYYGAGSYAAKICYDLTYGGYSDWFLPSLYELNKLYLNKTILGIGDNYYWSSSDRAMNNAWAQYFPTGGSTDPDKLGSLYVRAIRYF